MYAGMTVSASIPAAVISMAVLMAFKDKNILENNMVQTAASAGESLAAKKAKFRTPVMPVAVGIYLHGEYRLISGSRPRNENLEV